MRRPTPPRMSTGSMQRPRPPSWPPSGSTPGSAPPTCIAKASPRSRRPTSQAAAEIGCVVKLLAICERVSSGDGGEAVSARVHPVMLPRQHPLAGVDGAYNAVYVEAEAAGRLMFYGPGAGGAPTASAVLGDLVAVARNRLAGGRGPRESAYADLPLQAMGEVPTRYHISLDVEDRAGVLAAVATAFRRVRGVDLDGPAAGPRRWTRAGHGHPQRARCRAGEHGVPAGRAGCRAQGGLGDASDGRRWHERDDGGGSGPGGRRRTRDGLAGR